MHLLHASLICTCGWAQIPRANSLSADLWMFTKCHTNLVVILIHKMWHILHFAIFDHNLFISTLIDFIFRKLNNKWSNYFKCNPFSPNDLYPSISHTPSLGLFQPDGQILNMRTNLGNLENFRTLCFSPTYSRIRSLDTSLPCTVPVTFKWCIHPGEGGKTETVWKSNYELKLAIIKSITMHLRCLISSNKHIITRPILTSPQRYWIPNESFDGK